MTEAFGGIEAGGTKFICAVGSGPETMHDIVRIDTTTPSETFAQVLAYFQEQKCGYSLKAVGIGSFGPVDLDRGSPTYGYITSTPKPHWANTDFAAAIERELKVPVAFDTDVNAAALGEYKWGAARECDNFFYLTVGTGIGGGAMINGQLVHGLSHPEMGHVRIPHDPNQDPFAGLCPYHGNCLEGLASGVAIEKRWNQSAQDLPPDHPAWELESHYLALALVNYFYTLSPQRIIMGGGVMEQKQVLPLVRRKFRDFLNNYGGVQSIRHNFEEFVVSPELKNEAGILGAIALAQEIVG